MCCGVYKDELIVRIAPDDTGPALKAPHTRLFDITGRPMKGWILVAPAGLKTAATLGKWTAMAVAYAGSLPKK
jgi:hypothetical protein